uniref:Protein transport protein SEC23 n=1 Tax=Arcella intermedia TaxID=1963864 RepID=A0A6B2KYI8_9EUKA
MSSECILSAHSKTPLPQGIILEPMANLKGGVPCIQSHTPPRCTCGAYLNPYAEVDTRKGTWKCNFCGRPNAGPDGEQQARAEQTHPTYDFPSEPAAPPPSAATLFLIDGSMDSVAMKGVAEAVLGVVAGMEEDRPVGMMVFSSHVYMYSVASEGMVSCCLINGEKSPGVEDLKAVFEKLEDFICPVGGIKENIRNILGSIQSIAPPPPTRNTKRSQERAPKKAQRCFGVAIEVAVLLLGASSIHNQISSPFNGGNVCVLLSGIPNHGPGALPENLQLPDNSPTKRYYSEISQILEAKKIVVDIFCGGRSSFSVETLDTLSSVSSGILILHQDFGEEFMKDFERSFERDFGIDASFSLLSSEDIQVTHITGPVAKQTTPPSQGNVTFKVFRLQPSTSISISFKCNSKDVQPKYFQFCVSFTSGHASYKRVITHSLNITKNLEEYYESCNIEVLSLLIAKNQILLAKQERLSVAESQAALDKKLRDILMQCRTKSENGQFTIPTQLSPLPRIMFLFRRGPLLGSLLQHPDDKLYARNLFLNGSLQQSYTLLVPNLYAFRKMNGTISLLSYPVEDLALQSSNVLVLDEYLTVFVWAGGEVDVPKDMSLNVDFGKGSGDEESKLIMSKCVEYVKQITKYRFPAPHIKFLVEGHSDARWLVCRLIPSHKDSPEDQIANFPQLAELDPTQKKALLQKFWKTEDLSFVEYYNKLWN